MARLQNKGGSLRWWFGRWWFGRREFWRKAPLTTRSLILTLIAFFSIAGAVATEHLKGHFALSGIYADNEPALQVFAQNRTLLEGANRLFIDLRVHRGTVWNADMLARLRRLHERVARLEGVDETQIRSLWRSDLLAINAGPDGVRASTIFAIHPGQPSSTASIAIEAHRAGAIGRYVSEDERSALIVAPLKAQGLKDEPHVDYRRLTAEIDAIQREFSDDQASVEVSGPPLWASRALSQTGIPRLWLLIGACLTIGMMTLAFGSLLIGAIGVLCVACALLWTLGSWSLLVGDLSPYAALSLAPVIVFGLLLASLYGAALAREIAKGAYTPASSALPGLRRVLFFATLAAAGVSLSLSFTPLGTIREAGSLAALGMLAQGISIAVFMPLLSSLIVRDDDLISALRFRRIERHAALAPLLKWGRKAPLVIFVATMGGLILLRLSLPEARTDIWPIAPRAAASASTGAQLYKNLASRFPAGLSTLSLIASAPAKSCLNPAVLEYIDTVGHDLAALPGVVGLRALPDLVRQAHAANHGGHPKWLALPRHPLALLEAMAPLPSDMPLSMRNCSVFALHVDLDVRHDPAAVLARAKAFFEGPVPNQLLLSLSAPADDAALTAATQRALEDAQLPAILRALAILLIAANLALLNGRHAFIALLPAGIILFVGLSVAPILQAGRDITTLALVVIWAGVGGALGIALQRGVATARGQGEEESEAAFDAVRRRGSALAIGAACGVVLLSFSLFAPFPLEAAGGILGVVFIVLLLVAVLLVQPAAYAAWAYLQARLRKAF